MGNLQASASSSTPSSEEKYDVFLSFRGQDIRDSFANTLREALKVKHIKAFMDDELPKGERISQLFKTIEESKILIVIFSENYGSSEWCLNELVKIMECKKINKQTVKPVFYGVKPSAVREDSFVKLKEKFPEEVPKWKEALIDASGLVGWESFVTRPDTKLVNAIVDDICKKLTGENILSSSNFKGLIGLDERIKQVQSLLCLYKADVRIIGIWGMGGIGKTTLVGVVFNQISGHQFEGVCFIENVREKLKNNGGLDRLQKDILTKVLNDKKLELDDPTIILPIIKKRLNQTKVFIVLDDVDDFMPIETLAAKVDGLGQGSRIIITSRDKQVLRNCGVNDSNIYGVEEFNGPEALQLFCNYAFKQNHPTKDLKILSIYIVNYAKGNPLALKVLGSSLNQKSKKEWESAVNKLRTNVDRKIFDVLKITYDGLNTGEQEVFLDIACFLKGEKRDYVASIIDDCECSLSVLIDRSLITISYWGTIEMHDLLQDLGRDIVHKESPKKPGERSRLWRQEDVQDTLKHGDGTNAVQGIFLDMFKIKDSCLSLEAFNKMYNLRLLKFYNSDIRSTSKLQFQEGQNNAPFDKLRSFIWFGYPLPALSSNFNLENLVELNLSCSSNLERLWEDTEHAPKLKWLDLHDCPSLIEVPDLSKSTFLEKIDLGGYSHLTKIQNFSNLALLEKIDLHGCSRLTEIPDLSRSSLLKKIDLGGCSHLTKIQNLSNLALLEEIDLHGCSCLTEIPDLSGSSLLRKINLGGCSHLTKIQNLSNLALLVELNLDGCSRLTKIPDLSGSPLLKRIYLEGCKSLLDFPLLAPRVSCLCDLNLSGFESLRSFPSTIVLHYKYSEYLDLSVCINLTTFPQISGNIKTLDLRGTAIDEVLPSIENLIKLSHLDLSESTRLKHISTNICKLKSLKQLNLRNCSQLESFPEILDKMERLKILILSGTAIKELHHSIENLIKLSHLNLSKCTRLKQISTNICKLKSLMELNLRNCSQLESFPEILDKMEGLEILILSGTAIKELPHSIENLNELSKLYLRRCKKLEKLPCSLISLKYLNISDCSKLKLLSDNFGSLKSLEDLSMDRIAISQLPSTMMHLNEIVKISCCGCRDLRFTDLLGLPCSLMWLYLNDCNLKKIPEDIGCLSSLKFLELSGNNFESLPKSMKQLYKLTSLKVDNCNMLQSLIDLPSALEHLSASGCSMLQSLTDLPSALEHLSANGCNMLHSLTDLPSALEYLSVSGCNMLQSLTELPLSLKHLSASGCKQLQSIPDASEFANLVEAEFIFTNCLNLKETAVGNMLATLKEGYEEGDEIGELTFFCPGSKVPEWFMYRTEGSSIVECCELKFQMPWHDGSNGRPLLGFVVCAVVAFEKYCCIKGDLKHLCVVYKYTCSDGDESSPNNITVASRNGGIYISVGFRNETLIDSDHIAFRFFKISVPRISESGFSNCSFELWLPGEKNSNCRIKSFGVCPIYAKHNITLPSFKSQKQSKTLGLFH